jgi:peptidoglycan/LPS O-acetylase OafA/YrhL
MILAGVASYFYRPRRHIAAQLKAALGLCVVGLVAGHAAFTAIPSLTGMVLVTIGSAWLLPCLREVRCSDRLAAIGQKAAAPTFSIYIVHYPVIQIFTGLGMEQGQITAERVMIFVGLVLLEIVVALSFFFAFERNTPRVRLWLRARLAHASARQPKLAGAG